MIRPDINVIFREKHVLIRSNKNSFAFKKDKESVFAESTAKITNQMLNDLKQSGIVEIEHCNQYGGIVMTIKDFFSTEKLVDVIISIFEKYDL